MTGCKTTEKYNQLIYTIEIPVALRDCADLPKRPSGEYTQREVAAFIARLNDARKDCKNKLHSLRDLVDDQNRNVNEMREAKK